MESVTLHFPYLFSAFSNQSNTIQKFPKYQIIFSHDTPFSKYSNRKFVLSSFLISESSQHMVCVCHAIPLTAPLSLDHLPLPSSASNLHSTAISPKQLLNSLTIAEPYYKFPCLYVAKKGTLKSHSKQMYYNPQRTCLCLLCQLSHIFLIIFKHLDDLALLSQPCCFSLGENNLY